MKNEITLIVGKLGSGKSTLANYALLQYDKAVVISSFAEDFSCEKINNLESAIDEDKFCFQSDELTENEIAIRLAYELGNRLLVIDEAHLYQDSESFKKVMRYSRHKRIDVILISHSLFDFARLNRVLVNNILVFNMNEPYEISYLKRINENIDYDKLGKYEFVIAQGELPSFFNKKDLTLTNNIYILKKDVVNSM